MNISPHAPNPMNYTRSSLPPSEPPIQIQYKTPDSRAFTNASRYSPEFQLGQKNYINSEVLYQDQNVKISQEYEFSANQNGEVEVVFTEIVLETGNRSDTVKITGAPDGKLLVTVNGKRYLIELLNRPDLEINQPLHVKTHGGNDSVVVAPEVTTPIRINLGDGNDYARAGGGPTQIRGGSGDDVILLGSDNGVASGEGGNDVLVAGTGSGALYGGEGNDWLLALDGPPERVMHMDAGKGNDSIISKSGHSVIHGNGGKNRITTLGSAVIYTGRDKNNVNAYHDNTVIYAKPSDNVTRTSHSRRFDVHPSDAGKTGYSVVGSTEFKERVEDDLELLRMSPTGQQGLKKADELARQNNAPITIRELNTRDDMNYAFNNKAIQEYLEKGGDVNSLTPSELGFITDGKPGATADRGTIIYNPSLASNVGNPIIGLYHEMAHAFNGATGTSLPGSTALDPYEKHVEEDLERQAIGLPTVADPFDFDGDPETPPTTTNPRPFTENGLRQEMRVPLRKSVDEKP
ncbi:M91 family zinc metallopeptidase [Pseudomonas sp. MWU16-30323]|uniref:M91 family zinc metallopeptidase n=1 Tax=Pseudomonas sp. MWU16-30323 TaxID=2878094 RepID=UPI001CFBE4D8|nr:M91 family zinc metallopeptidase [Pseudomonas sp. MWU16-30323]